MLKCMFQFRFIEGTSIRANLDEFDKGIMDLKNIDDILTHEK